MAQYIDKSALVAEIKRLLDKYISVHTFNYGATQDLNHLLSFLDTLKVEEVDLEEAANKYAIESYPDEPSTGQFGTGDYESYVNMSGQRECAVEDFKAGAKWHKTKDESITEDLGEYINELSKQFPEVSFAKLSRIAVRVAKWKEQQMMAKAIVREVKVDAGGYPYIDATELYDYDKDMPLAKEGDKVKVIIIKED